MNILTNDNRAYNLDKIPNEIEDIRYCVLDYSDPKNPDYKNLTITLFHQAGIRNPSKPGNYIYKIATQMERTLIDSIPFEFINCSRG